MSANSLRELFIEELKDVVDAERRLTKALPKMAKTATSEELVTAFEEHLKQTEEHVTRVETVLSSLQATAARKTCKAMVGLLAEGDEMMKEEAPSEIKDVMLIAAAQKVEHYEIATYRSLCTWARELGEDKAVKLLEINLKEESAADERLTKLALPLTAESNGFDSDDESEAPTARGAASKSR